MANQFDARLYWRRREIWTHDEPTGAYAMIRDTCDGSEKPFRWLVSAPGQPGEEGRAKSEQTARNAVRSRIVKLPVMGGA